ncbi:YcaO-like family protein [Candidatus Saccharibacteria bacterium]|nr:YcaO-like family protein [Candidatus Saccharibacteria bacterium]
MEKDEEFPRYQIPGAPGEIAASFHTPEGILEVDSYQDEIFAILRLADGTKSRSNIIKSAVESGLDEEFTSMVMDDLERLGVIGDSRQISKLFHIYTKNPARYSHDLSNEEVYEITSRPYEVEKEGQRHQFSRTSTDLTSLLSKRESVRGFESRAVELDKISEILDAAYSFNITPVPSAGGLYPLKLYLLIKDGNELPAGYYQYDPTDSALICFNDNFSEKRLQYIFNSDSLVHNAQLLFVIGADMDRHSEKYADRGYRYTLLEAGHVAQNIHLACTTLDLGSLEYGGFNDDLLHSELNLDERIQPLITIGAGYKNTFEIQDSISTLALLEKELVGKNKPIDEVSINFPPNSTSPSYYQASAHYVIPNVSYPDTHDDRYASGAATSIELAKIKAIAEAYERYVSGKIRFDIKDSATNLRGKWLNPNLIRPLSSSQINFMSGIEQFQEDLLLEWVKGSELHSNEDIFVPIDLVYYPLNEKVLRRNPIALADSSGVAAHVDRNIAIEKGLLELIERDAIMRNWFKKAPLPKLSQELLDEDISSRVLNLEKNGYIVDVLDMTEPNAKAAVINVVIRNKEMNYPYFVNGASAALNYQDAIDKALEEAELGLKYALIGEKNDAKSKNHIHSPADHGNYYLHPENAVNISWLWSGEIKYHLQNIDDSKKLIDNYNPIVINLELQSAPLNVVRIIEISLVPISFGLGAEYYTHPFSGISNPQQYQPYIPHYFA